MVEWLDGFGGPVFVLGLELGVEVLEGLGEGLLKGAGFFQPLEGLRVGAGFEEGGGFRFALGEEGIHFAQVLADLLEEGAGVGQNVVHLGGRLAVFEGEEVLEAAFGVAQGFVRGV